MEETMRKKTNRRHLPNSSPSSKRRVQEGDVEFFAPSVPQESSESSADQAFFAPSVPQESSESSFDGPTKRPVEQPSSQGFDGPTKRPVEQPTWKAVRKTPQPSVQQTHRPTIGWVDVKPPPSKPSVSEPDDPPTPAPSLIKTRKPSTDPTVSPTPESTSPPVSTDNDVPVVVVEHPDDAVEQECRRKDHKKHRCQHDPLCKYIDIDNLCVSKRSVDSLPSPAEDPTPSPTHTAAPTDAPVVSSEQSPVCPSGSDPLSPPTWGPVLQQETATAMEFDKMVYGGILVVAVLALLWYIRSRCCGSSSSSTSNSPRKSASALDNMEYKRLNTMETNAPTADDDDDWDSFDAIDELTTKKAKSIEMAARTL